MQGSDGSAAGRDKLRHENDSLTQADPTADSLLFEMRTAANAAVGQMRKIAATAASEAQLNAASAAAIALAALVALVLLVITWICVVALGVWLAIQAGAPVWAALLGAVLVNLAGVFACRFWYGRLVSNIGFARTRGLLLR
jgi:hypothetical protein